MYAGTIRTIAKAKGLSQSDLARLAGVSRQAVSLWFHAPEKRANLRSRHLENLSQALRLPIDELLRPLPFLDDPSGSLKAALIWDKLYPSLENFVIALCREDLRAMARLVEVYGLFRSAKMLGEKIWARFPDFKRYLPPVRRLELERLWKLRKSLGWL